MPPAFDQFSALYTPLAALLDSIKNPAPAPPPGSQAPPDTSPPATVNTMPSPPPSPPPGPLPPPPPKPTLPPPPPSSNPHAADAPAAYATAHGKASSSIAAMVQQLSTAQINYLTGLQFTTPGDFPSNQADVVNSVLSAWDMPASKYMNLSASAGDSLRPTFQSRLMDFDVAIQTTGSPGIAPDSPPPAS